MTTRTSSRPHDSGRPGALEVRLLGLLDFRSATGLQEWISYEIGGRRDTRGVLILCEHPPLISIGREGSRHNVQATEAELAACEMPVQWMSRSGGTVVHAPGQLAAYLMLPLDRLKIGLGAFRDRFEEAMLAVCRELKVPTKRLPGTPGLWSRGGQVGHFGAVVKSWVTQQGMWLNVHPDPGFLRMVRSEAVSARVFGGAQPMASLVADEVDSNRQTSPRSDQRVTSLQEQLLRRISMHQTREATIRHIAESFEYTDIHLFTGHPQLTRTRQRVCLNA